MTNSWYTRTTYPFAAPSYLTRQWTRYITELHSVSSLTRDLCKLFVPSYVLTSGLDSTCQRMGQVFQLELSKRQDQSRRIGNRLRHPRGIKRRLLSFVGLTSEYRRQMRKQALTQPNTLARTSTWSSTQKASSELDCIFVRVFQKPLCL